MRRRVFLSLPALLAAPSVPAGEPLDVVVARICARIGPRRDLHFPLPGEYVITRTRRYRLG